MSTKGSRQADRSIERTDPFEARWDWKGGSLAGLLATAVMGVAISVTDLSGLQIPNAGL